MSKLLLITSVFTSLLTSCASRHPILELSPVAENTFWLNGREFQTINYDNLIVSASFEENSYKSLSFNFNISNKNEKPYLVEPEKFKVIYTTFAKTDSAKADTLFAINPEDDIKKLKERLSDNKAREINQHLASATFSTLDIAEDIIDLSKNQSNEELQNKYDEREKSAKYQRENLERIENEKSSIDNQLSYYNTAKIRKTTLLQNSNLSGYIDVPFDKKAENIIILMPIDSTYLKFEFNIRNPIIEKKKQKIAEAEARAKARAEAKALRKAKADAKEEAKAKAKSRN